MLLDVIVSVALGGCLCGLIRDLIYLVDGLLVDIVPLVLSLISIIFLLKLNVVESLFTIF